MSIKIRWNENGIYTLYLPILIEVKEISSQNTKRILLYIHQLKICFNFCQLNKIGFSSPVITIALSSIDRYYQI